ncbi:FMN reductase [Leucobacter exalbidus]|uniref:FMN reductase n=1 Tax=Leucobacter exalbidus TaxID=662960 RepID=A0A940PM29_9MICO|nr:CE1759 family FMN reductase [Leucobacter exalbidus]MBP1325613.1 FMN reductase [Leucobacter exalbidus]
MTTAELSQIVVVSGTLSSPSKTTELGRVIAESVREYRPGSVRVIEVAELTAEIGQSLILGETTPGLREALDAVESADVLVAVSPVFKGSYSGLFKHFFDLVEPYALTNKPTILGATGGSARHSLVVDYELRPLFNYFNAHVAPVAIFATGEDFRAGEIINQALLQRIDRAAAGYALRQPAEIAA